MTLSYDELLEAVTADGVGVRAKLALEPLDGPGGKVFPSSYGVEDWAESKYALEQRKVVDPDGTVRTVESVVLASVADLANRQELALLDAYRSDEVNLPVISTDFSGAEGVEGLDRISSLEAPHRVFDSLLRDSLLDGRLFRMSDPGRAITEATTSNAAALYHWSPTTLLFGGWDSTGPKGGRGSKYERAITSEIVANDIARGVKTSSRIDPAGIELKAGTLYQAKIADPEAELEWTLDPAEAVGGEKKPTPVKGGGEGTAGRPSQVNHGNITPSIDAKAGGVTAASIELSTVLSFIQLRRLRFPVDHAGSPIDLSARRAAEAAARAAIAALGLAAAVLAYEEGFDLRSRCVLTATDDHTFELIRRGSAANSTFTLTRDEALALVAEAARKAADLGLSWAEEELLLTPADRLVELVRRSQAVAESNATEEA